MKFSFSFSSLRTQYTIGIILFFLFSLALLFSLQYKIDHTYLEDDMFLIMPTIVEYADTHSFLETAWFLLDGNEFDISFPAVFLLFLFSIFGPNYGSFVVVSFLLHVINALLFFFLLHLRIRLSFLTSFLAGLFYFSFYGQFHSYVWPVANQHLFTTFFILLISYLYFLINERVDRGISYRGFYWTALALSIPAAFIRLSILILPIMLLVHVFFTARDYQSLRKKLDLWLPFLFIFIITHVFLFVFGDFGSIVDQYILHFFRFLLLENIFFSFFFLLFLSLIPFFLLRIILAYLPQFTQRFLPFSFHAASNHRIIFHVSAMKFIRYFSVFFLLCVLGFFTIIFVPLFSFFLFILLNPFLFASSVAFDFTRWQPFPVPEFTFGFFLIALLSIFLAVYYFFFMFRHNQNLIIFLPWYILSAFYIISYLDFSELTIPSRYFIYVTPFFSVALALVLAEFPRLFNLRYVNRFIFPGLALVALLTIASINLSAIHTENSRTVFGDYQWSYDYIKISQLIKNDLMARSVVFDDIPPSRICVAGIHAPNTLPSDYPRLTNGTTRFKHVFASVFRDKNMLRVRALEIKEFPEECNFRYLAEGVTVFDAEGKSIEPFHRTFLSILQYINDHKTSDELLPPFPQAIEQSLVRAISERPFFISFIFDNQPENSSRTGSHSLAEAIALIPSNHMESSLRYMVNAEIQNYSTAVWLLAQIKENQGFLDEAASLNARAFSLHPFADQVAREKLLALTGILTPREVIHRVYRLAEVDALISVQTPE